MRKERQQTSFSLQRWSIASVCRRTTEVTLICDLMNCSLDFRKKFVLIFSLQWFISCSCFFKYFLRCFFFYSTNSGPWILSLCGTLISVYTRQSVHLVTTFLVGYYCSLWVYSNTTAISNAWVDPSEQSALGTRSITSERNEVLLLLIRLVHNLS